GWRLPWWGRWGSTPSEASTRNNAAPPLLPPADRADQCQIRHWPAAPRRASVTATVMRARALRRQVRGRASAVGPFALAALMLPGLSGCSSDGPQGSSSTHWLTCEVDAECA